jgi:hypothetical protein
VRPSQSDAELARLDHAAERHGLQSLACPACVGLGCNLCDDAGVVFVMPLQAGECDWGPRCPLLGGEA